MECKLQTNLKHCNCTYEPCPRKGQCCECLRYHWSMAELPACLFPSEAERSYDRSLERFLQTYGSNK